MLNSEMNPGIRGSTRATWSDQSARDLLRRLIEQNPRAGKDRLEKLFHEAARDNDKVLDSILLKVFTDEYRSWQVYRARVEPADIARVTREAAERVAYTAKLGTVAQLALLQLTMPNGKLMRNCTGTDMKTFGGAYARIGRKCGMKTVGQVLNEAEV